VSGSEAFAKQLSHIQRRVYSPAELRQHFVPLFDALASMTAGTRPGPDDMRGLLQLAETLAEDHPVPAYGYPKTYMQIIAGDLSKPTFFSLARGDPPPDGGSMDAGDLPTAQPTTPS
tara:strand:+ start:6407 stop:6757 length:351 start_codon:yes stop_codon:yes gene_type:complete